MKRSILLLLLGVVAAGPAGAGHELSFYPSYYPQEIRIAPHAPAAAAELLKTSRLHAYVGSDPLRSTALPAHVKAVESLGGYLVLRPVGADADARCRSAAAVGKAAAARAGAVFHPYPVTPYHADYLHHADRAQRVAGTFAEPAGAGTMPADASAVEAIALDTLLGEPAPPWRKEGWYHAYLLQRDAMADRAAREGVDALFERLTTGRYAGVERLDLERELVARLGAGCERVVLGYALRTERYTAEFSDGIENVAADSHAGLRSAIFVRTAKLKDFPWNGWLSLGVPDGPTAAWNPVAGFTDPTGRLVWAALGDPAFIPVPGSASWIGNRVTLASLTSMSEVPKDALLPEAGTGAWRPVARAGTPAAVKLVYRVLASPFHDGTRMGVADTLYGLGFGFRTGADPAVEPEARRLRDWLAGVRLVGEETSEREFGEVKFVTTVQTIEVYSRHRLADDLQTAAVTAPWAPVPWTVLALAEAAVRGGLAAFSAEDARRRGVPWLDLARDRPLARRLLPMVDDFARQGFVPAGLAGRVTPAEATARWQALGAFYRQHGHFLATNGPYRLKSWGDDGVVLEVFRDLSYPLGVGSYDRYALPRRAHVARVETREGRLLVHVDVETVRKFQREYEITTRPLRDAGVDTPTPVCRYVAVGADGAVKRAGPLAYAGGGAFAVEPAPALPVGTYTVAVGCHVEPHGPSPEPRLLTYRVGTP